MSSFPAATSPRTPTGPERFTLTYADCIAVLGCSDQAIYRWCSKGDDGPLPHWQAHDGAGYKYLRPDELVCRLRTSRKRGCHGTDVVALLDVEYSKRGRVPAPPDLFLGEDGDRRAGELLAALDATERERWGSVRGALHSALVRALWTDSDRAAISRLLDRSIIHPAVMRYVIGNNAEELPPSDDTDAWMHWSHSYSLTNIEKKVA